MTPNTPPKRRSNHKVMPLAYAAIGASDALDLMRFPPDDSTPYEEELQLGSGVDRFLTASNLLMTWGAQRAAGVEVIDIEVGAQPDYEGVQFTEDGVPELNTDPEHLFSPEGEPFLVAGTSASFQVAGAEPRRIMVVSTIVEEKRLGFAWGDRDEVPGCGEQLLTVEHRADGTVWAVARGFAYSQASGLLVGRKQRSEMRDVVEQAQAFLGALAPGVAIRTGVTKPTESADSSDIADSKVATQASTDVDIDADTDVTTDAAPVSQDDSSVLTETAE